MLEDPEKLTLNESCGLKLFSWVGRGGRAVISVPCAPLFGHHSAGSWAALEDVEGRVK